MGKQSQSRLGPSEDGVCRPYVESIALRMRYTGAFTWKPSRTSAQHRCPQQSGGASRRLCTLVPRMLEDRRSARPFGLRRQRESTLQVRVELRNRSHANLDVLSCSIKCQLHAKVFKTGERQCDETEEPHLGRVEQPGGLRSPSAELR